MITPSALASVSIGKEASFGAGATPALLVPCLRPQIADSVAFQIDQSWLGSPVSTNSHTLSGSGSTMTINGPVYADSFGFWLAGILGDVVLTAGSPNTYTMALETDGLQQPPSYAITLNDPTGQIQFPGCVVAGLSVTFDPDAAVSYQATVQGLPAAVSSVTVPSASSEVMLPSWAARCTVGGTVDARVAGGTIDLARQVTPKSTISGQTVPYWIRSETLTVSGSLTIVANSDAYRQSLLNGAPTTLLIATTVGTGTAARALTLRCSKVTLTAVARDYSDQWVELDITFDADSNTTDVGASGGLSPVWAQLKNTVPAGTYF